MDGLAADPYVTLGVSPGASDEELLASYRRLVQLHHPDHNGGSAESAQRFEEIQAAYARIRRLREEVPHAAARPGESLDPEAEARIAQMEREIREVQAARDRAEKAAAETVRRPSDEELGYVRTDDSLTKIFADARAELAARFSERRQHPAVKRLADLIDEIDPRTEPR
jgi:curved DNA-binding protein CbpA